MSNKWWIINNIISLIVEQTAVLKKSIKYNNFTYEIIVKNNDKISLLIININSKE